MLICTIIVELGALFWCADTVDVCNFAHKCQIVRQTFAQATNKSGCEVDVLLTSGHYNASDTLPGFRGWGEITLSALFLNSRMAL